MLLQFEHVKMTIGKFYNWNLLFSHSHTLCFYRLSICDRFITLYRAGAPYAIYLDRKNRWYCGIGNCLCYHVMPKSNISTQIQVKLSLSLRLSACTRVQNGARINETTIWPHLIDMNRKKTHYIFIYIFYIFIENHDFWAKYSELFRTKCQSKRNNKAYLWQRIYDECIHFMHDVQRTNSCMRAEYRLNEWNG